MTEEFKKKTLNLMDKLKDAIWEESHKKMENIIRKIVKLQGEEAKTNED